ncbi:MAG: peptidase [Pseudomonadales bacterium]|jgi:putative iron-regulated protein|nr:peptidase [Pseudomonadales bacterium]
MSRFSRKPRLLLLPLLCRFCCFCCLLLLQACHSGGVAVTVPDPVAGRTPLPRDVVDKQLIVQQYIAVARASYADAALAAQVLDQAVNVLLDTPTDATLQAARAAWRAARIPYMQTEVFRFGNHNVVDEWESRVNAWPLDEGLIDYVSPGYVAPDYGTQADDNAFYTANVIANPLLDIGGISVDASRITPQFLAETLHQIGGVAANVATGYHAIEFLLWGQNLHGARPYTDYSLTACSNGHCERRRDYLRAATDLLVDDLEEMVQNWQGGGAAVQDLLSKGEDGALATILTGMGSLAYGELAGTGLRLGLLRHDPENAQDGFSNTTHWSHFYDALGIDNVYRGQYRRIDGEALSGPSLEMLVQSLDPALYVEMRARLESIELAMRALVEQGEAGNTYAVLIQGDNAAGAALINRAVTALMEATQSIEKIIDRLALQDVRIEGSSSLPPRS